MKDVVVVEFYSKRKLFTPYTTVLHKGRFIKGIWSDYDMIMEFFEKYEKITILDKEKDLYYVVTKEDFLELF